MGGGSIGKRTLMREQHAPIGDRDHIIVERAGRNRLGILLDEHRARRVESMPARDDGAGLFVLARGVAPALPAPDEHFGPGRIMALAKPHVVGRAFVAEARHHRIVDDEGVAAEGKVEQRFRVAPFLCAVRHGDEVGRGQMAFPVGGVGGRRDGRRIGRPHRGCGPGRRDQRARGRLVGTDRAEKGMIGARKRGQETLRQTQREIVPHLGDALQRGCARIAGIALVTGAGDIAEAEPGIIVRGTDDPVEIDFLKRHGNSVYEGLTGPRTRRYRPVRC